MAYYLQFDGDGTTAGDYVTLDSGISFSSSDDFSIYMEVAIAQNINFYKPLGGDNLLASVPRVLIYSGGRIRLINSSNVATEWFTGINLTTIEKIEFRRASGVLELLVNDVVQSPTVTGSTDVYTGFRTLGGNANSTSNTDSSLYRLQFTKNSVLIHDYDPSASGGTGLVLTDIVSGNNGTLVNFPTDDSQWVFYASGPTAYTITADSVSDAHTAQDVTLNYAPGVTAYSITCDAVSDSHAAGAVDFYRGYNLTVDALSDSHTAQDATLIYSAGVVAYSITCETVFDAHTAQDVLLYRGYTLLAGSASDNHQVQDVAFYRGYNLTADAVTDTHNAAAITLTYTTPEGTAYSITCESVSDSHQTGAIAFNRGYVMQAATITDNHLAIPVTLRYSGEEIVLITTYSVNYKQDIISASYKPTLIEVTYGGG